AKLRGGHRVPPLQIFQRSALFFNERPLPTALPSPSSTAARQTDLLSVTTRGDAVLPTLPSARDCTPRQLSNTTAGRPNRPTPAPPLHMTSRDDRHDRS